MLWKLRQETMEQDDPTDDITKTGGRLSAWTERPHMSKEDMYMKEIALMQESNHKLLIRVKELGEEINRLKEKMDANL
tara:strand:- start:241 stop:474 length:234 start_codon:yes stop_codon:yes gene_type:complete